MTDKDIAIKVENLTKTYKLYDKPIDRLKESLHWRGKKYHKDFYALNDVRFEIKKGETVGIIGKNGSGKSTLLKIITGVLTPTSGNVTVNGKVSALLELGAGFNPEYTGLENIYFQGAIMGYERHEIDAKVDDILAFADIGDFIYQPYKTYSSGMGARLAFAVAINVEPDILIVDEALSVGDMAFQNKCMQKMKSLINDHGCTVIFVSHALSAVRLICDRVVWLKSGNLEAIGDVETITDLYEFEMSSGNSNNLIQKNNFDTSLVSQNKEYNGECFDVSEIGEVDKSQNIYINKVWITDKNNLLNKSFYNTFEDVVIIMDIFSDSRISVSIGVAIIKIDGLLEITRINNIRDEKSIFLNPGKNIVKLQLKKIMLLTGEYYLSVYLAHNDLLRTIHKVENFIKITIKTPFSKSGWREYDGLIAAPHEWNI